ncbi:MAG TPA: T9SS type A sorting domain-containing protein [Bacteroidales bacterium]|nr:T9SS type A sorting domain-containing protein [Bacteroidales bacterium]
MNKISLFIVVLLPLTAFTQHQKQLVSGNKDINGVPVLVIINNGKGPLHYPGLFTPFAYDSVRPLSEINDTANADAYPWISPDGLRLYYTHGSSFTHELMFTQRANVNSYFDTAQAFSIGNVSYPISIWLSADELDAYLSDGDGLYYAHRSSASSPFDPATPISLSGISLSFIAGPSLNPSQDELFIYWNNDWGSEGIVEFSRISASKFNYTRTLILPTGYSPGPGQLSKDGLTYFLSANDTTGNPALYQLTRATLADSFSVETFLQIKGINDTVMINGLPSMSDSLKWVVFIRAVKNNWLANELYIAHKASPSSIFDQEEKHQLLSLYPNPANSLISVKTGFKGKLLILNIQGQQILQQDITAPTTTIDVSSLPIGVCLIKLVGEKGVQVGKFVKQ